MPRPGAQDQKLRSILLHVDVGLRIISENLEPGSGDKDLKGLGCPIQDTQLTRALGLRYGVIDHLSAGWGAAKALKRCLALSRSWH